MMMMMTISMINVKTTFKKDYYRRQSGTSKTAKIGCFDRFPCSVYHYSAAGFY